MSVRMGKKLTELGAQVTRLPALIDWRERIESGATPGCHPVALAVNFAAQGLAARDAFVVHQYGVGGNDPRRRAAADADQPRGHAANAPRAQCRHGNGLPDAQRARDLADMAGFAPLAEILAAVHVKAHVRLFMN